MVTDDIQAYASRGCILQTSFSAGGDGEEGYEQACKRYAISRTGTVLLPEL
jgi:hypothetical protein